MTMHEFRLADIFGSFLAEGARAAAFRLGDLEQCLAIHEEVILDFDGVHNVNSSFANALIAPLIEIHGDEVLDYLRFKNCNGVVRVMIEGALSLGLERAQSHRSKASA